MPGTVLGTEDKAVNKRDTAPILIDPQRDVSKNCGVRASENFLLHKSHEKTDKHCQNQLSRTLEINQSLGAIQGTFIQEK